MSDPPFYPHDPPEQIAEDVFMVRGSIRMNPLLRITRNMGIVRRDRELTLINPIRLSEEGYGQLAKLGSVQRLIRLGPFHGVDDAYTVRRFSAPLMAPGPSSAHPLPEGTLPLSPDVPLPFPHASLFSFRGTKEAECALLLQRDTPLLLTCDAIQHYGDYRHNNLPARILLPWVGFPKTTLVGPIWLKVMTLKGESLRGEFERLLAHDFDALLAGHGSFLASGAKEAVAAAVERAFAKK
ncbi:MAG: hypothetical protein HKP27_04625 [Myxococcales bacterium]|nr:hypothetical protein [Myxococcales bacterium]